MKLNEKELTILRRLIYEAFKRDCSNFDGSLEDLRNLDNKLLYELSKIESAKYIKGE